MGCGSDGDGHSHGGHGCHVNDADGLVVVKQNVAFFFFFHFYSLQGRILFLNTPLNGLRLLEELSSVNVIINLLYIMKNFFISGP